MAADDAASLSRMPDPVPNIGREMAKGTGWMVAARLGVQAIGFLSTLILARLLVPADFGLVALATAFSEALQAISEFGLDVVLIQNRGASRAHYDTAWTLAICRNSLLALCLIICAAPMSPLLGDARLEAILYWLATATFIGGFQNVGVIDFRKHLAFHKDLVFMVLAKLSGFVVTVPLAFLWRDYWALVVGIVLGAFARVGLSYVMHHYRPRLSFACWREIMHFSKWLLLTNVTDFAFIRTNTFVVGRMAGAIALGSYTMADEIAGLITSNLLAPLRRAIFPGYAKVSEDPDSLRRGFVDVFALVVLVAAPLTLGIGLVADPLVRLCLGANWIAAIPLIQVLSVGRFFTLVTAGVRPILLATGKPHYAMWVQGGTTLILVPLSIVATHLMGAIGAAYAALSAFAITVPVNLFLVMRLLGLPADRLWKPCWRPLAAAVVMALAVLELSHAWPSTSDSLGWSALLAAEVGLGAVVYPTAILGLWLLAGRPDGAERHGLDAIRWGMRRLRKHA
jgi:O-antigen/teichoic acid export membrane protein